MNRISEALCDNFEFGGNLSYFDLCLTYNLTMTNFLYYPPTFKWAKCLTSDMSTETPRGQTKKVMIFPLWFDMHWYGLAFCLHADAVWWIEVYNSVTYKFKPLNCRGKWVVALILFLFSFKCSWHITAILRCSRPEVFCKEGVLKHFAKSLGKQLWRSLFFRKVAGRLIKGFRHMCFFIKFAKFWRTFILKNNLF